jgi:hypothetical protein
MGNESRNSNPLLSRENDLTLNFLLPWKAFLVQLRSSFSPVTLPLPQVFVAAATHRPQRQEPRP